MQTLWLGYGSYGSGRSMAVVGCCSVGDRDAFRSQFTETIFLEFLAISFDRTAEGGTQLVCCCVDVDSLFDCLGLAVLFGGGEA